MVATVRLEVSTPSDPQSSSSSSPRPLSSCLKRMPRSEPLVVSWGDSEEFIVEVRAVGDLRPGGLRIVRHPAPRPTHRSAPDRHASQLTPCLERTLSHILEASPALAPVRAVSSHPVPARAQTEYSGCIIREPQLVANRLRSRDPPPPPAAEDEENIDIKGASFGIERSSKKGALLDPSRRYCGRHPHPNNPRPPPPRLTCHPLATRSRRQEWQLQAAINARRRSDPQAEEGAEGEAAEVDTTRAFQGPGAATRWLAGRGAHAALGPQVPRLSGPQPRHVRGIGVEGVGVPTARRAARTGGSGGAG